MRVVLISVALLAVFLLLPRGGHAEELQAGDGECLKRCDLPWCYGYIGPPLPYDELEEQIRVVEPNMTNLVVLEGKEYYFAMEIYASADDAVRLCGELGMDLLSIESEEENLLVREQIAKLGCYNKAGMMSLRGSSRLSFHCFPQSNARLAAQWRRCIGREDASKRMRICSDHFLATDFLGGGRHRKLRRGVIPSIIPAPPSAPLYPHTSRMNPMNVWKYHSPVLEVTPGDEACRDVGSSSSSSRDSSPAPPTPSPHQHQQSPWSVHQQQQREAAALALLGLQTPETASWSQRETAAMGLLRLQTSSWSMQQRDAALGLLRLQAGQPSHISPPVQWHQQQREVAALALLGLQTSTPRSVQEQREAAAMGLLGLQHGFQVGQQLLNNTDPRQRGMLHSSLTQLMHMHALEHQYKLMQLHLLQRTASSTD